MKKRIIIGALSLCCLFTNISFAHEGIAVRNFEIESENGKIIEYRISDKVDILDEVNDKYLIRLDGINYETDKENILKTKHIEDGYLVSSESATLRSEPDAYEAAIKNLTVGEKLIKLEENGLWARVLTKEKIEGWVYLEYLEDAYYEEEIKPKGYITVNETTRIDGKFRILQKGQEVNIDSVDSSGYTVTDVNGNTFKLNIDKLSLTVPATGIVNSSDAHRVSTVIDFAYNQLGKPYVWGATGMDSYDCSGLMLRAYETVGIELPRVSADQGQFGEKIDISEIKAGDMLFFNTLGDGISHVGIYIGNNQFIQAPSPGKFVEIADFNEFHRGRFVVARRVL